MGAIRIMVWSAELTVINKVDNFTLLIRKAKHMKKVNWILVLVLGLMTINLFGGETTNFSGTWTLDETKLTGDPNMPRMDAKKIIVKQNNDSLATERFYSNPMMGDFTVSEKLTLDGKECKTVEEYGTRLSTATWSEDMKCLTINSTLKMNWDGQDVEMGSVEIWSLEQESILKIDITRDTPMGSMKDIIFYNKL